MADDRYCSNCRAELPRHAQACPACGVFAGDLFDGRTDVQKRTSRRRFWTLVIVASAVAIVIAVWLAIPDAPWVRHVPWARELPRFDTGPTRVVRNRPGGERRAPGAALTEAEATRVLRRQLTSSGDKPPKSECLAVLSHGPQAGSYLFTAYDSCSRLRLGKWRVDGKSGAVSRAKP